MRRVCFALVVTVLGSCGTDKAETADLAGQPQPGDVGGRGSVAVHIEDVDGFFIEGFEVGLRFESATGDVISSTLWSDFVTSQEGDESLDAYYDSVLEQNVPAGEVIVLATANVGAGPPPEIPDIAGDLRCRLAVDVPADGRVDIEVTFDSTDNCLRLM